MSEPQQPELQTVYVKLLDEGTEVTRPTLAAPIANGEFELLATHDYDPENETWEFLPGSKVAITETIMNGTNVCLAVQTTESASK